MADERRREHLFISNHDLENKHIGLSRTPPPPRLLVPGALHPLSRTPPPPQRISPSRGKGVSHPVYQRPSSRESAYQASLNLSVNQPNQLTSPGQRTSPNIRVSPIPRQLLLSNSPQGGQGIPLFQATGLVQLAVQRGASPNPQSVSPQPPPMAGVPTIRLPDQDFLQRASHAAPGTIAGSAALSGQSPAVLQASGLVPLSLQRMPHPRLHVMPHGPRPHGAVVASVSPHRPRMQGVGVMMKKEQEGPRPASLALAQLLKMRTPQQAVETKNSTELYIEELQKQAASHLTHPGLEAHSEPPGGHPLGLRTTLHQVGHPLQVAQRGGPSPQAGPTRGGPSPQTGLSRGGPSPHSAIPPRLTPPVLQVPPPPVLGGSPFSHLSHLPSLTPIETMPQLLPEGSTSDLLNSDHPYGKEQLIHVVNHMKQENMADDTVITDITDLSHPSEVRESVYNMRVNILNKFPSGQTAYRATYRSHSVAILRAKAGAICNTAKSLDLLRQNLQNDINKEIDLVVQKYINEYFSLGIKNIKENNGEASVTDDHVQGVCRQMLEEAKKMYLSETRSITPDLPDNVSESGSLVENRIIRDNKRSLFNIRERKRRNSSDSEASSSVPRRKKKGRPALLIGNSGRSTPSKTGKNDVVKREGRKWDPERLKPDTKFVMGARANKALGLGQTRGRLYIKHPDVFKYSGDQDDKTWLYENHHMPATGGKAYLLLVEDIQELAQSEDYRHSPGLLLDEIIGFCVPDWMLDKMKGQMGALRSDKPKHKPLPVGVLQNQDEDSKELPFSLGYGSNPLTNNKVDMQASPSNTDMLSTEQEDDDPPSVSPLEMTGGFGEVSPAPNGSPAPSASNSNPQDGSHSPSPAPSDLDGLDDEEDGPITEPFGLH